MILAANWKMYGNQALLKQWSESLATQHDHGVRGHRPQHYLRLHGHEVMI